MAGFDPWRSTPAVAKTEWQPWRSREIVWVKPHTNSRGEQEYRAKSGETMPAEVLRKKYELMEDKPE